METLHALDDREDTLSEKEKNFLDELGFLNLGQLLSDSQVKEINCRIQELMDAVDKKYRTQGPSEIDWVE